jgi:hypothetical protein
MHSLPASGVRFAELETNKFSMTMIEQSVCVHAFAPGQRLLVRQLTGQLIEVLWQAYLPNIADFGVNSLKSTH